MNVSARSSRTDLSGWALIALVVVVICGVVGWLYARQSMPGGGNVQQLAAVAHQTGMSRGEQVGYRDGRAVARREAALRARTQISQATAAASRDGYRQGYASGRSKAGDPDAYVNADLPSDAAYPSTGYEDVLAQGLFGSDAAGYSSSSFDDSGLDGGSAYDGGSSSWDPASGY